MEIERKLASIQRIAEIKPIEGADRIVAYRINGWWVVSQKDAYKVDDLVTYFEIDSFLPVEPQYEFLRKSSFRSTKNLGDGFRIKTIKLKGQISQGLILPVTDFPALSEFVFSEGDDLTELLKVVKYESPGAVALSGIARGSFPHFIPKTDQERYQNLSTRDKLAHEDDDFEISIKMDGASMTVFWNEGDFGVCSRNLDLKEDDPNNFKETGETENLFWKVARKVGFRQIFEKLNTNLAFQGELCGPGVQGNPSRLKDHDFFLFDIYDIDAHRYYTSEERKALVLNINQYFSNVLQHVPILPTAKALRATPETLHMGVDGIKFKTNEESEEQGTFVEGLVFKNLQGTFSFKLISNNYLLKEVAEEAHEYKIAA